MFCIKLVELGETFSAVFTWKLFCTWSTYNLTTSI